MKTTCSKLLNRMPRRLRPHQSFPADSHAPLGAAVLAAMGLIGALASPAFAAQGLVNVDVIASGGWTFSGAGVLGSAGDVWNELAGSSANLKNSTGDKTNVRLTISGSNMTGTYANTGGTAPANVAATSGLLGDYLNTIDATMTFKLSGLRPNSPYDLVVYCAGNQTDQSVTLSGAISYTMGPVTRGAFVEGGNYARNTSAVSDATGTLTFSTYNVGWQGFNGLQIAGDMPVFTGSSIEAIGGINVDVCPSGGWIFSSAGVLGSAGDVWNELTGSTANLKNLIGDKTAVGITISGHSGTYANTGGTAPANDPATMGLMGDYLNVNNGTITVQLTGLRPNAPYDLVAYCAGNQTDQNVVLSGAINYSMGPVSRGAFVEGANYARNTSAMTDASGTLKYSATKTGWQGFNGLQIVGAIPLPSSFGGYSNVAIGADSTMTLSIPAELNHSQDFTVSVTNGNPASLSLSGAVDNVLTLTFPRGTTNAQSFTVRGIALGTSSLMASYPWPAYATIVTVPTSGLVGHWLAGQQDLTDTSGYSAAGTHDGVAVGTVGNYWVDFSSDVPAGFSGYSGDLNAYGETIRIQNTSKAVDGANYMPTFDTLTAQQITVALWAKRVGTFTDWQPFASKRGEGSIGWSVRKAGSNRVGSFTVRGTPSADDVFTGSIDITDGGWHHFAATYDGITGMRKLYVDGKLNVVVPNDFGTIGLAQNAYLVLGGQWNNDGGTGGNVKSALPGLLYDVRIYALALDGSQIQNLVSPNTSGIVAYASTPTIDLGKTGAVAISIPDGANATQQVVVSVTNMNPSVVSIAGTSDPVFSVIFPVGSSTSKSFVLTGLSEGQAQIGFGAPGLTSASASVTVYGNHLIGQWFNGAESLADVSGFNPAGTHDGVISGNEANVAYSTDVPPSKTGKSLNLKAGGAGILITNTSVFDPGYVRTFDDVIAKKFSVSLWVKGSFGGWASFLTKRGEDDMGLQVRRNGGNTAGALTLRGSLSRSGDLGGTQTISDGQWHHVAAVWDGNSGVRQVYKDGVLDASLASDFGPFLLAPNHHLMLGAREKADTLPTVGADYNFQGLIYDVRVYNYPLSQAEVKSMASLGAIRITIAPPIKVGATASIDVTIPAGANDSQTVTVQVTTANSGVASVAGATTLTFPMGSPLTQTISLTGIGDGKTTFTASSGGYVSASETIAVWAPVAPRLIGRWFAGQPTLAEVSGFRPAGTHDGVAVGSTAGLLTFANDVPSGYSGQSLDLRANGVPSYDENEIASYTNQVAVLITNTAVADNAYEVSFDNQITNKFSVAFWAKGFPSGWNPWVSKNGESAGFQFRGTVNGAANANPAFTLRGTAGADDIWGGRVESLNDGQWHHYAGTWDGQTGIRTVYLDGAAQIVLSGDTGGVTPLSTSHLMLGARDNNGFGNWFSGQLFDVRVYSYAVSPLEVALLVKPPTALNISLDYNSLPIGETAVLKVAIPAGSNDTQPVTVVLVNNSPSVVTLVGAVNNVLSLTFPAGSLPVQTVTLLTVGPGAIDITATMGATSVALAVPSTVSNKKMIGRWVSGDSDLTDKSGFTPAGTHDGVAVGNNPELLAFTNDVPAGFTGNSLDLTKNTSTENVGVAINNSSSSDASYQPTYDAAMANAFTVTCWAKGSPGSYIPFVSKAGEDNIGWQIRRGWINESFTIRGTLGDDNGEGTKQVADGKWHHYAGVWDGIAGIRRVYVDGVLDVDYTGDFGPMVLGTGQHLAIGARENAAGWENYWFPGLLYDVRIYNYAISQAVVQSLTSPAALRITGATPIKVGETATISVTIPGGANDGQPVEVSVSTANPAVASVVGAAPTVLTLTFPQGGALTQTVSVTGNAVGKTAFSAAMSGYPTASETLTVWSPAPPTLIGCWFAGQPTLADVSGFRPAGTHDGVAVGSSAASLSFANDVPAGYTGQSLDLTANGSGGQIAIMITNTAVSDNAYEPTYDNQITNKLSIAFWAKGYPPGWAPWISKNGENNGFQFRGTENGTAYANPTFSVRGTAGADDLHGDGTVSLNDGQWHHYAGTWDGQTGLRSIYVDGALRLDLSGDTGAMALATSSHLVLGGRENGGFGNWFAGQLFDVRIYSYPLSVPEIKTLAVPPTALSISMDYTSVPAGDTFTIFVTIPSGANATQPITVMLTNNAPSVATIVGSVGNVLTLTFPAGGLPTQSVPLVAVGPGNIDITAIMAGVSAKLSSTSTVFAHALVGRWLTGDTDLKDKSGFTPTGTHDGVPSGNSPQLVAFNNSVPPGFHGQSLDLTANSSTVSVGVIITNSSINDSAYRPTFDNPMAITVAFWAKGFPIAEWEPFVTKCGETSFGWAMRRGRTNEAFTIRGTAGSDNGEGSRSFADGNWHHYVGTWDGVTGIRQIYVDGVLDPSSTIIGDFGPMGLALDKHLGIGTRENPGWADSYFPGLLYDVRVYNYAIAPEEVAVLQVGIVEARLTVSMGANNTIVISWPSDATGYVLQSSTEVDGIWSNSSLSPTIENGQYVVSETVIGTTKFYRLVHTAN